MTQQTPGQPTTPRPDQDIQRVLVVVAHPDHLAAGEAAIRAVYPAAGNRFAWPELIERVWSRGTSTRSG